MNQVAGAAFSMINFDKIIGASPTLASWLMKFPFICVVRTSVHSGTLIHLCMNLFQCKLQFYRNLEDMTVQDPE